jgi:hypothetical protein
VARPYDVQWSSAATADLQRVIAADGALAADQLIRAIDKRLGGITRFMGAKTLDGSPPRDPPWMVIEVGVYRSVFRFTTTDETPDRPGRLVARVVDRDTIQAVAHELGGDE